MPSLIVLATADSSLADAWEKQLPPGKASMRLSAESISSGTSPGFAAVVVLDSAFESFLPGSFLRHPIIYVGEPKSGSFEQAKMTGKAKAFLSYDESFKSLLSILPLVEEISEKQSMVELLNAKARRPEPQRASLRPNAADAIELWDFIEGVVENLDSRERMIAEFRRASRHLLRASHSVFFLREADGFRADRGTSFFAVDDPLVGFFENHPAVLDGSCWEEPVDPVAELAVRNKLAMWGARLLAPVHDNGRLLGLIALGVRNDGQSYDESDRARLLFIARLLRHFLSKAGQLTRLISLADKTNLGIKYLPSTLVLGHDEGAPRQVPLVVRDLVGQVRRSREVRRIQPAEGQPFRASAGLVAETGGIWAFWEEASGEVHDAAVKRNASRRELLRELALTLSHELNNALVSLKTFRQARPDQVIPLSIIETVKNDVSKLEELSTHFELLQTLHEAVGRSIDVRDLVQKIGASMEMHVDVGPDPVLLLVSEKLLDFALRSLIATVAENRMNREVGALALQVRSTGAGADLTVLLSLKGKNLELEGILPEPTEVSVPNQGRLAVFIAKEILRLHKGEIHAGPGLEGTEILISIKAF